MTSLVIVGAGGFGREVYDIVVAMTDAGVSPWRTFLGYVDDSAASDDPDESVDTPPLLARAGIGFLGSSSALTALGSTASYAIGIGAGDVRRRLAARFDEAGCVATTLIHPMATVGTGNLIGAGCIIAAGARVTTNITLGTHVDLHVNATVGHDSVFDHYVSVYPGATVGGTVHLGEGVTIGTGANVLPGLSIGAGAYVGAGAVVTRDVAAGVTVVGVPARPLVSNE